MKKIIFSLFLLGCTALLNAQTTSAVEGATETGYGLQNGAVANPSSSTGGAVFYGFQAGNKTTTKNVHGDNNSFIGHQSGFMNTTGANNTFLGSLSGLDNTSGSQNVFLGGEAGTNNTSGSRNTFIGQQSGFTNITGQYNTFTGWGSGRANTASNNTFNGYQSGYTNTTGTNNTFLGFQSGLSNSSGLNNICIGAYSGYEITTGSNNVYVGTETGTINNGSGNVIIGQSAGREFTGSNNLILGNKAGEEGGGSNNVFIGSSVGNGLAVSNKLYIDNTDITPPLIWGDFALDQVKLNGKVGIGLTGTNLPQATLDVNGIIRIAEAGTIDNNSPGIVFGLNDDFTYMGRYLNHYGLGTYNRNGNSTPYYSGFWGMDFFTGGTRRMNLNLDGQLLIGMAEANAPTTAGSVNVQAYKLFVKGGILTEEVRINLQSQWADYVFAKEYKLATLPEVEKFITANGHLPNVPSAAQVKEEGIALGEMAKIQQEKIEELTLYLIEQNKRLIKQDREIEELKAAVKTLSNKQ